MHKDSRADSGLFGTTPGIYDNGGMPTTLVVSGGTTMLKELKLLAPMYLYLPGDSKRHYLSFNNYHNWPVHIRTSLRRAYGELLKKQLSGESGRFYGEVECTVVLHPPKDDRVRDTDDHCFLHAKWANDALKEAGLYKDDQCVLDVHLLLGEQSKEPHVAVCYSLLSQPGERSARTIVVFPPSSTRAIQPAMDPAVAARSYVKAPKRKTDRPADAKNTRDPRGIGKAPKKKAPRIPRRP